MFAGPSDTKGPRGLHTSIDRLAAPPTRSILGQASKIDVRYLQPPELSLAAQQAAILIATLFDYCIYILYFTVVNHPEVIGKRLAASPLRAVQWYGYHLYTQYVIPTGTVY